MAINSPRATLRRVVLDDVDMAYAEHQLSTVTDILRSNKDLSRNEREVIDGLRNLLTVITNNPEVVRRPVHKNKRMTPKDVNRCRDLHSAGLSNAAIADRLGYKRLAIQRCTAGQTHQDVPYEPSEFALEVEHDVQKKSG